jgi:hypothetical protein
MGYCPYLCYSCGNSDDNGWSSELDKTAPDSLFLISVYITGFKKIKNIDPQTTENISNFKFCISNYDSYYDPYRTHREYKDYDISSKQIYFGLMKYGLNIFAEEIKPYIFTKELKTCDTDEKCTDEECTDEECTDEECTDEECTDEECTDEECTDEERTNEEFDEGSVDLSEFISDSHYCHDCYYQALCIKGILHLKEKIKLFHQPSYKEYQDRFVEKDLVKTFSIKYDDNLPDLLCEGDFKNRVEYAPKNEPKNPNELFSNYSDYERRKVLNFNQIMCGLECYNLEEFGKEFEKYYEEITK